MDPHREKPDAYEPSDLGEETQAGEPGGAEKPQTAEVAEPVPPAEPEAGARPGRGTETGAPKGLGIAALALALLACIAVAYLWYRMDVQGKHRQELAAAALSGEINGILEGTRALEKHQDRLTEAQDRLVARQDELAGLIQEKLDSSVAELRQQQEALAASVGKIYQSMDRSIDSWALEEVEQLLRMANHSVGLTGDIQTGITALEYADGRLADIGNPELLEVRRLIADEMGRLKSLERVDLPGLAFRLAGIVSTVDSLPLVDKPSRPEAAAEGAAAGSDDGSVWVKAGQELLDDLKDLVRIQNVTEPARPLLPPEQRYFLTGNLRLLLSGAQIAVLRADTATFGSNLQQAIRIISDYFDTGEQSVRSVLDELEAMSGENLAVARPDISGSIKKLKEIKTRASVQ